MGKVVNKRKLDNSEMKIAQIDKKPKLLVPKQEPAESQEPAQEYIIEDIWHVKIVKISKNNYDMEFQVKWFEWSETQNTFETYENGNFFFPHLSSQF